MAKLVLHIEADGSLRLPPEVLAAAGLGDLVELELEPGAVALRPVADGDGAEMSEEEIVEICRGIRREMFEEKYGHRDP